MADAYRFIRVGMRDETYQDGTIVPHLTADIERQQPDGSWSRVGYVNAHLHRVLRDATDVEDISLGFTGRINTKVSTA